jgi:CheY-like chemotaxis protein
MIARRIFVRRLLLPIAVVVALAGCLMLSPVTAQEAKPKSPKAAKGQKGGPHKSAAPEKEKPAATEAVPEEPAVAAILATKPTAPAECTRAAKTLCDLGRDDLAKNLLNQVVDANLDADQLADLGEECGSAVFLELAGRHGLLPEAKTLADAVLAAVRARRQDAERIADLIGQLQDPSPKKRVQAAVGLQQAGGAAIGPLIGVLADASRAAEHANCRAVLAEMGRAARDPLMAVVADAGPDLTVQAIGALAEMGDPKAAICLLTPYASPASAPPVKAAAAAALQRLGARLPTRPEAARRLTDAALAYFDRRQPVEGGRDGRVNVWRWDGANKICLARSCTLDEAAGRMAARWAAEALGLAGDDATAAVFSLAADLDVRARVNGLDRPLPPLAREAQWSWKLVQDVLQFAMTHRRTAAAAAAARILGRIGTASTVLYQGAGLSPLVAAVRDPDRRLQVAALEAIVRLQPIRAFAGSSYVPDALAFLASAQGARRAAVASAGAAEVRDLTGLALGAGYEADGCQTGRDLVLQAARSPDYELAMIDVTIDRPTILTVLQQLRRDPRTAGLPVALTARSGDFGEAERIARTDPRAKAFARPRDAQACRREIEQLEALPTAEFVPAAVRLGQAGRALELLADLEQSPPGLYDLRRAEQSAVAAIDNPTLAAKAVLVLAGLGAPAAQRALVELASRPLQPMPLRQAAYQSFRRNTRKFGVLLGREEILRQYRRYNESVNEPPASRRLLSLILDCLELAAKKG